MLQIVKTKQEIAVDEGDIITLAEAARLSGRTLPSVAVMLDRGTLPWYEYAPAMPGRSGSRYTSKSAVLALAKRSRLRKPARK